MTTTPYGLLAEAAARRPWYVAEQFGKTRVRAQVKDAPSGDDPTMVMAATEKIARLIADEHNRLIDRS